MADTLDRDTFRSRVRALSIDADIEETPQRPTTPHRGAPTN